MISERLSLNVVVAPGYQNLIDDQRADVIERAIERVRQLVAREQKPLALRGRVLPAR
jgi:hypothetical protein